MSIVIFWIEDDSKPNFQRFTELQLTEALSFANAKRQAAGMSHVVISSVNANEVGCRGVDSVDNGRLPSGQVYEWKKRR